MTRTTSSPIDDRTHWNRLALVLRLIGLFALATGLGDVVAGARILEAIGAELGSGGVDPVLNSQVHYLGAMWAGFGITLWWCARDLRVGGGLLPLLMAAVLVGGVGRLIAAMQYGPGPALLAFFIAVELLAPPAIILWQRRLLATDPDAGLQL